jgi:hypothetical protein
MSAALTEITELATLRIDHVYLVSCKYLSKVLLNPGPARLFERLLIGEERTGGHWFTTTAPSEYQAFYRAAAEHTKLTHLPDSVDDLTRPQQQALRSALSDRALPAELRDTWLTLCQAIATESASRWARQLRTLRQRLRLLWRLLRISTAAYFVLGTDRRSHIRVRVDSAWDWIQAYELRAFIIAPRASGQPEVLWSATVRPRSGGPDRFVEGHVEIRWSHGRFVGSPEAKVYLDTRHTDVPGYNVSI